MGEEGGRAGLLVERLVDDLNGGCQWDRDGAWTQWTDYGWRREVSSRAGSAGGELYSRYIRWGGGPSLLQASRAARAGTVSKVSPRAHRRGFRSSIPVERCDGRMAKARASLSRQHRAFAISIIHCEE